MSELPDTSPDINNPSSQPSDLRSMISNNEDIEQQQSLSDNSYLYDENNFINEHDHDQDDGTDYYVMNFLQNLEENEPIFDNILLYPTPKESEIARFKNNKLIQGTIESLITYVTSPEILDYQTLVDFFLTFRVYIESLPLLEFLLCRLLWSLKNSDDLSDEKKSNVGKIVLVRTFVTIRHWLLNHFQDDFVNNVTLRKLFTSILNEISKNFNSTSETNTLQMKIIHDLKKSYTTACSTYWDLSTTCNSIDKTEFSSIVNNKNASNNGVINNNRNKNNIPNNNCVSDPISAYEDFNSSRLSVAGLEQMHNTSYRRSMLLDMFDKQTPGNIFNNKDTSIKEATNLKNPLEKILEKRSDLYRSNSFKKNDNDPNTVLYPKGSINALKSRKFQSLKTENSSIDVLFNNLFSELNNKPLQGVIQLDNNNNINDNIFNNNIKSKGFTISGNIDIFQDSKINEIESLAKEFQVSEITAEPENLKRKEQQKPKVEIPKKSKNLNTNVNLNSNINYNHNIKDNTKHTSTKKKGFFKNLFSHHDKENYNANGRDMINMKRNTNNYTRNTTTANNNSYVTKSDPTVSQLQASNQSKMKSQENKIKSQDEFMHTPKLLKTQDLIEKLEKSIVINDSIRDYLEDLILYEYQEILQHPSFKERYSKQLKNSNRKSILSLGFIDRDSKSYLLNSPIKVNNTNPNFDHVELENQMSGNKSFQTPPDTMDWSNSIIDNSHDNFIDMGISSNDLDNVSNLDTSSKINFAGSMSYNRNNINNFNNSNQNNNAKKILKGRLSLQNHKNFKYISSIPIREKYNSDSKVFDCLTNISDGNGGFIDIFNNHINHNNQPGSFNNLNNDTEDYIENDEEYSINNRSTGNFSITNKSIGAFSANIIGRSSNISGTSYLSYDSELSANFNNKSNRNQDIEDKRIRKMNRISNLRIQDSNTESVRTSEHDGLDMKVLHELQELPYYNEIGSIKSCKSEISILPSPTPSQTVYTGISNTNIKELAAIPDERLDCDPLNYTLSKLRGERKNPQVILGLNDTKHNENHNENDSEIHKKHAIAIVCQSPTKEKFNLIQNTLNNNYDEETSNDEVNLENQVKDLYISNNNFNENNEVAEEADHKSNFSNGNKLEMNLITNRSNTKLNENGSTLTKISSSKLLRNDGEVSNFEIQSLLTKPKFNSINPLFTINQILDEKMHIPFIFKYDSEKIAKQMTLIERDIIMEVDWKELVNLKWMQPQPCKSWLGVLLSLSAKTGLELITSRFNLVNNWIISEILLCKDISLRVLTITRFIQLAQTCRTIQNYATLFQIMLALNTQVMKELKDTWMKVDMGTMMKFKQLNNLTSPDNDFKNYRNEIEKIIPSKGFIPFLSLELNDLTHFSSMPTIINSKIEYSEIESNEEFESSSDSSYDLVNFEKFKLTGETVKKALRYIEWSKFYNYENDTEVISKCLYLSSLCEEEMELCLHQLEGIM